MINKEWETEPDLEDFIYKGYDCKIWRNPDLKHLCGYARIPEKHAYFDSKVEIEVHDGITFSGEFGNKLTGRDDTGYWIGFSCGQAGCDIIPRFTEIEGIDYTAFLGESYKNFEFVRCELKSVVEQLIAIEIK